EGEVVAGLYGVQQKIHSAEDFMAMMHALLPGFEPHPINTEFLSIMKSGRAAPGIPKGLQSALVNAAVEILPPAVRGRLGLGGEYDLSPAGRFAVKSVAYIAENVPDTMGPHAQACQRLGLPRSFLWKSQAERARLLEAVLTRPPAKKVTP
ncbi:MAG: oxygenase MpaB family protein, partial [Hyphomonas sp.]|uniref:oxygenase MpaB family protein n=1 Tax=Hyphomonas sp. TaxID=87 RepID=UPI0034A071C6